MDDDKPPLEPTLRALAQKARRDLDDHPTPEELVAYRSGELTPQDEERIQDHLALCRDCSQLLLDLKDFEEDKPEDEAGLSDAQVEAAWRRLRPRLEERKVLTSRRWFASPRVAYGLAAALFVCVVGLSFWVSTLRERLRDLSSPEVNFAMVELEPIGETSRGAGTAAETGKIPAGGLSFGLVLHPLDPGEYSDYEIDILPGKGGDVLWSQHGVQRADDGMRVRIPRDFLPAGAYRIRLYGLEGDRRDPLGEFAFEISPEPAR